MPRLYLALAGRSEVYVKKGEFDLALRDINEAIRIMPGDFSYRRIRDKIWRRMGREDKIAASWGEMAEFYANRLVVPTKSTELTDDQQFDYFRYACAIVRQGNEEAIDRFRLDTINRFGGTRNWRPAERMLRVCLLSPLGDPRLQELNKLCGPIKRHLATPGTSEYRAWANLALAMFEYRNGDFEASLQSCKNALTHAAPKQCQAMISTIGSMNHHRLEQLDLARAKLDEAAKLIDAAEKDESYSGQFWYDWECAAILRDEAIELAKSNDAVIALRTRSKKQLFATGGIWR